MSAQFGPKSPHFVSAAQGTYHVHHTPCACSVCHFATGMPWRRDAWPGAERGAARTPKRRRPNINWAPISAADFFRTPAKPIKEERDDTLTPLSQLPTPFATPVSGATGAGRGSTSTAGGGSAWDLVEVAQLFEQDPLDGDEPENMHTEANAEEHLPSTQGEPAAADPEPYGTPGAGPAAQSDGPEEEPPLPRPFLRLSLGVDLLDALGTCLPLNDVEPSSGEASSRGGDADEENNLGNGTVPPAQRGFPTGSGIEITGPPGSGKTTWAARLAVHERLAHVLHALESAPASGTENENGHSPPSASELQTEFPHLGTCGQAVLLDTEGSLIPALLLRALRDALSPAFTQMVQQQLARIRGTSPTPANVRAILEQSVLEGIHVVRIVTPGELLAYLYSAADDRCSCLPPNTSLLILDSLTFFYANAFFPGQQWKARNRVYAQVLQALRTLRHGLPRSPQPITVVATAQMATRNPGGRGDRRPTAAELPPDSVLVPALTQPSGSAIQSSADISVFEWGASVLGSDAWRLVLFRDGIFGHRCVGRHRFCTDRSFVYIQAVPPTLFGAYGGTWQPCIPFVLDGSAPDNQTPKDREVEPASATASPTGSSV